MSIFEDVKQALDIRKVVEYYGYDVNRADKFICPFHKDTHPSAGIKNDYFHCFVCGAGGDVISFTAKLFGLKNFEACKKLAEDFGLHVAIGQQTQADRLRADRERAKRQAEQKQKEEIDALIAKTGRILADYHCYLWDGRSFPFGSERNIMALQELEHAAYLLECYDANPKEYSINNRKQVESIEARLHQWYHEEQQL